MFCCQSQVAPEPTTSQEGSGTQHAIHYMLSAISLICDFVYWEAIRGEGQCSCGMKICTGCPNPQSAATALLVFGIIGVLLEVLEICVKHCSNEGPEKRKEAGVNARFMGVIFHEIPELIILLVLAQRRCTCSLGRKAGDSSAVFRGMSDFDSCRLDSCSNADPWEFSAHMAYWSSMLNILLSTRRVGEQSGDSAAQNIMPLVCTLPWLLVWGTETSWGAI